MGAQAEGQGERALKWSIVNKWLDSIDTDDVMDDADLQRLGSALLYWWEVNKPKDEHRQHEATRPNPLDSQRRTVRTRRTARRR